MKKTYLAFDLGADSGRAIYATIENGQLSMEELHRFPTRGLTVLGRRQWDITRLHSEMITAMTKCADRFGSKLNGLGIDTWGVDYGLIGKDGQLLGNPNHYRDTMTNGMREAVAEIISPQDNFARTGITQHQFNTLYQLFAQAKNDSPALKSADQLLFIGSLLGYFLTGKSSCEYTVASTGQLLDCKTRDWDKELLEKLGIPTHILPPISQPGSTVGTITEEVAKLTGLDPSTPLINTAIHDTAAAVVAVPVTEPGDNWAFLSSGTWSLLGLEIKEPMATEDVRAAGITNEGGVDGTIRFLKNIFGLWIVQESRRCWMNEAKTEEDIAALHYDTLEDGARNAEPFRSTINLDDERLMAPENMPDMLRTIAREAGVPVPETRGDIIRCAFEGLALCYRRALHQMDKLQGRKTERLHIIGGGIKNTLLNQMTADACGIPVVTGPVEATAIGNIMVQAMGTGAVKDLKEARQIVANSTELTTYTPRDTAAWDKIDQQVSR